MRDRTPRHIATFTQFTPKVGLGRWLPAGKVEGQRVSEVASESRSLWVSPGTQKLMAE